MRTVARHGAARPPTTGSSPDIVERDDSVAPEIIKPARELDFSTGRELVLHLDRVLRTRRDRDIVVNLDEIEFIDAAGMRSLIECQQLALRSRRQLTFSSPSPAVMRLVRLFDGLDPLMGMG